jgi:hypothetical protein
LSARLDPEDMGDPGVSGMLRRIGRVLGRACRQSTWATACSPIFGWPRAHEDDGERVVRPGLALIDAVGRMTVLSGETLAARIGIATGLVTTTHRTTTTARYTRRSGLLEGRGSARPRGAPEAQLAKLEAVLGRSSDRLDEAVALLAALLGIPTVTAIRR